MKHCQEERTEDVLGNLEAETQKDEKKIHQTTVFEGQFLNESHHFSPWAGSLSCFSRKELLPLRSGCLWLKVMKEEK